MLLDSHESVHQMIEDFDPGTSDEITEYFKRHNVDATGVIHYGFIVARAALQKQDDDLDKRLIAIFCSGVALGLHLGDGAPTRATREAAQ